VAAQLGTPLMPWQRYVVDVALELDPSTGLLVYREIVLVVPRQSGKTTLVLAVAVHRALAWATRQNIAYTAQTRTDARAKWEDEHVVRLEESPIGKRTPKPFRVRKTNGQEAIIWRNGSRHGITAGTEKSGHGPTLDLGFVDEAFAQSDARLEQAYKPAMITRPDPQLWVISTAGKSAGSSPYLWGKVDAGRERCELGEHPGVAYFEWSADPDADRADPATWWSAMPALGHTVTEAAVRSDFHSMPAAEFDRAYLNIWRPQAVASIIPAARWSEDGRSDGIDGRLALAVDVSEDREWSTVTACGAALGRDGLAGEVIKASRGTSWVVEFLSGLAGRHDVSGIGVDARGPVASLIGDMERAGLNVVQVSSTDMAQACGGLLDDIVEGRFAHRNQVVLDVAVGSAVRRVSGDTWRWSRSSSPVDISPLVSLTVARWAHVNAPLVETVAADPDFIVV
jgi:phage terminase large subunit-like protein